MPLHTGKGRSVGTAISDILDYAENPEKTDGGKLITCYQCNSQIADAEFLFSKRQYKAKTGRQRGADDVIAYQVRQSFVPGEITPEEANRLGQELARRFTKGNHAFIVCTHVDKAHIHNHMLLTEGWDCPSVDCVAVLRPTKVRSLYSQMVGRGTRLYPGKTDLLLLDFLWHTERHELCHPANLICESDEVARKMTENIEAAGCPVDIEEAERQASDDVVAQREEALANRLAEMRSRKRRLVDPLQFEMYIQAEDLSGYVPAFGWEMGPPSDKQRGALEKWGICPDEIDSAGKASLLLDRLNKRSNAGLTTPRQIRALENFGLLSEHLVPEGKTRQRWVWKKIQGHERNEPLDCRNYAIAAFKTLAIDLDEVDRQLKAARGKTPEKKTMPKQPPRRYGTIRPADLGYDEW